MLRWNKLAQCKEHQLGLLIKSERREEMKGKWNLSGRWATNWKKEK